MWIWLCAFFQINASTHQHQTVTDSPYAKPNKATKSSPSPQPSAHLQGQQLTTSAGSSTAGSGKQNQLDSMLGNLQADMSRQGVNTTQKGCCNACDKPIVGQVHLLFLDKTHDLICRMWQMSSWKALMKHMRCCWTRSIDNSWSRTSLCSSITQLELLFCFRW